MLAGASSRVCDVAPAVARSGGGEQGAIVVELEKTSVRVLTRVIDEGRAAMKTVLAAGWANIRGCEAAGLEVVEAAQLIRA